MNNADDIHCKYQFITNFGIYQRPTDTLTLISYLIVQDPNGMQSEEIVADSGYGLEENYEYMLQHGNDSVCQIQHCPCRATARLPKQSFQSVKPFLTSPDDDFYVWPDGTENEICPSRKKRYTASGYQQTSALYERVGRRLSFKGRCHNPNTTGR